MNLLLKNAFIIMQLYVGFSCTYNIFVLLFLIHQLMDDMLIIKKSIDNKLGWFIMELPTVFLMPYFYLKFYRL